MENKRKTVEEKIGLAPRSRLEERESLLSLFILVVGQWRGKLAALKPGTWAPAPIPPLPKVEFAKIFGLICKGDWNFSQSPSSFHRAYACSEGLCISFWKGLNTWKGCFSDLVLDLKSEHWSSVETITRHFHFTADSNISSRYHRN